MDKSHELVVLRHGPSDTQSEISLDKSGHPGEAVGIPDKLFKLLLHGVVDQAIHLLSEEGTILSWNVGAEQITGFSAAEIVGRNFDCLYSEDQRSSGVPQLSLESALERGHYQEEGVRYRKDGTAFWASISISPLFEQDEFYGFASVTRDLTQEQAIVSRISHEAAHDPLTGILNRKGFQAILDRELRKLSGSRSFAILFVDLDRFKPINDVFGHQMGDDVLRQSADRLRKVVGDSGFVGRLGGDEFVIIQTRSVSTESAHVLGQAIVQALRMPFELSDMVVSIGCSVGIALAPKDGADVSALYRCADLALYQAKHDGRNRANFFDRTLIEKERAKNLFDLELRCAVESKQFEVFYQPIVHGRSSEISGYEALLRWTDRTGASVPPARFIPAAEELGLMPELGLWVLNVACKEAAAWSRNMLLAVNLSAEQLKQPGFAALVAGVLRDTGLPASQLELEITETAIVEDMDAACRTLTALRALGVGIALDDFGTGFSSLTLVHDLPLTRLKIDRKFVASLKEASSSSGVVDAIITLSRGYKLTVTAEGVETEHQRQALLASGCTDLQGYLFGRPAPSSEWHPSSAIKRVVAK